MKTVVLPVYRIVPIVLGVLGSFAGFGVLKSVAVLGLCEALTDAYNINIDHY
jgi:hypothetical protein